MAIPQPWQRFESKTTARAQGAGQRQRTPLLRLFDPTSCSPRAHTGRATQLPGAAGAQFSRYWSAAQFSSGVHVPAVAGPAPDSHVAPSTQRACFWQAVPAGAAYCPAGHPAASVAFLGAAVLGDSGALVLRHASAACVPLAPALVHRGAPVTFAGRPSLT